MIWTLLTFCFLAVFPFVLLFTVIGYIYGEIRDYRNKPSKYEEDLAQAHEWLERYPGDPNVEEFYLKVLKSRP